MAMEVGLTSGLTSRRASLREAGASAITLRGYADPATACPSRSPPDYAGQMPTASYKTVLVDAAPVHIYSQNQEGALFVASVVELVYEIP